MSNVWRSPIPHADVRSVFHIEPPRVSIYVGYDTDPSELNDSLADKLYRLEGSNFCWVFLTGTVADMEDYSNTTFSDRVIKPFYIGNLDGDPQDNARMIVAAYIDGTYEIKDLGGLIGEHCT